MKKVIILKPYLDFRIWGGTNLKDYGCKINPKQKIGEAWLISGYPNKSSIITNGEHKGKTLDVVYQTNPELFNDYPSKNYPLLTKILDCNDKLSIQIHPDDKVAKKFNSLGKNECWYVLKAKTGAKLIYGHKAKTQTELKQIVDKGQWNKLIKFKPVKKGDFIYVPAKTVHAINEGLIIFELQQASDITYRLYDYDRLSDGKKRDLHLKQSLELIECPFVDKQKQKAKAYGNFLTDNKYFSLQKIVNKKDKKYDYNKIAQWLQITVIDGKGKLDNHKVKKGFTCLITNNLNFTLSGNLQLLISFIRK